nr:hypothetical protein [Desulfitobacterium sp. PCE1]
MNLSEQKQNFAESLSVSFVRAAYGANGVKQNPGDSASGAFPSQITYMILLTKTIPERISTKLIQVPRRTNF